MNTMSSTNPADYDILIRRYDNGANYASYCPQLAHMIKGSAHEEVENAMKEHVLQHIAKLQEKKD
ncbi:hypothetical protein LBMAG35_08800 [Chlorobiota bacterium]|nr:hypothetical protein LBMAG35_08800 [Chlorobiota bacterium]